VKSFKAQVDADRVDCTLWRRLDATALCTDLRIHVLCFPFSFCEKLVNSFA
jgi:hypothetical protein